MPKVLAHVREIVAIAAVEERLRSQGDSGFSEEERRYAASKRDPARRLAARWAAKTAAAQALGGEIEPRDVEIVRGQGAPRLRLGPRAEERARRIGVSHVHVSLTHGLTHAAASVVLEASSGE